MTDHHERAPALRIGDATRIDAVGAADWRALASEPDVLVLDEPTNDLDIDTLELLEELLGEYPGTLLLVIVAVWVDWAADEAGVGYGLMLYRLE